MHSKKGPYKLKSRIYDDVNTANNQTIIDDWKSTNK